MTAIDPPQIGFAVRRRPCMLAGVLVGMLACLALAGTPGTARGAGPEGQEQALLELMARLATRTSATVRFLETKQMSELSRPLELRGTLVYRAPDLLRKQVAFPHRETYAVEGSQVIVLKAGQEKGRFQLDEYPQLQAFIESIRATLAGDVATLRRFYRVTIRGNKSLWLLTLLPRPPALAAVISRIEIQGRGIDLELFVIEAANGDRSTMRILDKAGS